MKLKLLFLASLSFTLAFGQSGKQEKIEGTNYSLKPPKGFTQASKWKGFQNEQYGASIMLTEFPSSVQSMLDGFTAEALKKQGMTLLERRKVNLEQSKGTLYRVSQKANNTTYLKQILIFGDEEKTVLVNGMYPHTHKSIEKEMRASILSIIAGKDESKSSTTVQWMTYKKKSFSIQYPSTWSLTEHNKGNLKFMISAEKELDNFQENINLVIQDLSGKKIDFDKFVKISEEDIKKSLKNFKRHESKKIKKKNRNCYQVSYTGRLEELPGMYLQFEQYYWVEHNKAYVLTFTSEKKKFNKYQKEGERIMNSFTLTL